MIDRPRKSLFIELLSLLVFLLGNSYAFAQNSDGHAKYAVTPSAPAATGANAGAQAAPETSPISEVKNALPAWLHLGGEYRIRPEDHTAYSFASGNDDGFVLSRLRLNVGVTPVYWFSAFFQAQDSEPIGITPAHITTSVKDVFDLRQAYVEFQNGEKGWLHFRVGRQELRYGQERLVGVSDWTNAPRVFDAFRLMLGTNRNHVDVFSASVVVNNPIAFDNHAGGMNFHGIYGSLSSVVPKARVEPYVFWKALPLVKSEEGAFGQENLWTYGLRWTGQLPLQFDYTVEAAKQNGTLSTDTISAWAGYANVGYSLPKVPLKPRVFAQYDYASGDSKSKDGRVGTFDQLYPSNHDVFGLVDLFGWRNIIQQRVGVDVKPMNRLTVTVDFRDLYLANGNDSLYSSTGGVLVKAPAAGALHRNIGKEPDILAKYDLRKNISMGAGYGHLFSGRFLAENSPGSHASIVYVFTTYKF